MCLPHPETARLLRCSKTRDVSENLSPGPLCSKIATERCATALSTGSRGGDCLLQSTPGFSAICRSGRDMHKELFINSIRQIRLQGHSVVPTLFFTKITGAGLVLTRSKMVIRPADC